MKYILLVAFFLGAASGYELSFMDPLACVTSPDTPIVRTLDANIPQAFSTPNFNTSDPDTTYPASQTCQWSIFVDPGTELAVTFFNFSIELTTDCEEEYVEVFDGDDDTAPRLAKLCGLHDPSPFKATNDTLFVRFVSDADDTTLTGFVARAGFSLQVTACEGSPQEFTSGNGIFATENYPINYGPARNCDYHFIAPAGQVVEISFNDFDVEECCTCDYLEAFNGGSQIGNPMSHWFGTGLACQIRSSGNEVFMHFESDATVSGSGFFGNYRFANSSALMTE